MRRQRHNRVQHFRSTSSGRCQRSLPIIQFRLVLQAACKGYLSDKACSASGWRPIQLNCQLQLNTHTYLTGQIKSHSFQLYRTLCRIPRQQRICHSDAYHPGFYHPALAAVTACNLCSCSSGATEPRRLPEGAWLPLPASMAAAPPIAAMASLLGARLHCSPLASV